MSVKFANNAFGTLNAGINNSATSITLSSGQGARFPSLSSGEYFYATLIDTSNNLEIVKCTARSTDVLTVTRAQESTTAQAFAIGDRIELRVTAGGLTDAANPYDKDTSSTGSLALPVGTTAQQPTAADSEGHIRYDSDDSVVYYSNGTNWLKISSVIATLSSATGNMFAGSATTLTLAGKGFQTANLVVNFEQSSDSIDEDVTVTPTSDVSATVTVPSAVYSNVTAGNTVSIIVTNSDGVSSAAVTITAIALPSGGTTVTSGGYRYHTFTSSGTFTNTVSNLSVDYLVIAGGGAGGGYGGGGGAGGYVSGTTTAAAQGHTITVGAGGADNGHGAGNNGSNTSALGVTTAIGGGRGSHSGSGASSGGSGGGGDYASNAGGAGTSGQGNAGGAGFQNSGSNIYVGGGGGGAGAAGANGGTAGTYAGDGGAGSNAHSTWASATSTGVSGYYAGGGAGGASYASPYGTQYSGSGGAGGGGIGGGGWNNTTNPGGDGTVNTGSGGGGAGFYNSAYGLHGGSGGSGVVIIRYQL